MCATSMFRRRLCWLDFSRSYKFISSTVSHEGISSRNGPFWKQWHFLIAVLNKMQKCRDTEGFVFRFAKKTRESLNICSRIPNNCTIQYLGGSWPPPWKLEKRQEKHEKPFNQPLHQKCSFTYQWRANLFFQSWVFTVGRSGDLKSWNHRETMVKPTCNIIVITYIINHVR